MKSCETHTNTGKGLLQNGEVLQQPLVGVRETVSFPVNTSRSMPITELVLMRLGDPCPDWSEVKTTNIQDTSFFFKLKFKPSSYSKYELYLLYLAGVSAETNDYLHVFRLVSRALFPGVFSRFSREAVLKKRRRDGIVRKCPEQGASEPVRTRNHSPEPS